MPPPPTTPSTRYPATISPDCNIAITLAALQPGAGHAARVEQTRVRDANAARRSGDDDTRVHPAPTALDGAYFDHCPPSQPTAGETRAPRATRECGRPLLRDAATAYAADTDGRAGNEARERE